MSTQHATRKNQGSPPQVPESPSTQDALQEEKVSPSQRFSQPPRRPFHPTRNRWALIGGVLLALALILSLGIIFIPRAMPRSGGTVTPVPTTPAATVPATPRSSDVTPTPVPGVTPGPQVGPEKLKDPAYWTPFLPAAPHASVAIQVTFGNLLDKPGSLQAMVVAKE